MLAVYSGNERLDKKSCLGSLIIMFSITLAPKLVDILSIINISGAFKQ